jgi:hypothetical protein
MEDPIQFNHHYFHAEKVWRSSRNSLAGFCTTLRAPPFPLLPYTAECISADVSACKNYFRPAEYSTCYLLSHSNLVRFIRSWAWWFAPKRRWTFNGLHGIISLKATKTGMQISLLLHLASGDVYRTWESNYWQRDIWVSGWGDCKNYSALRC